MQSTILFNRITDTSVSDSQTYNHSDVCHEKDVIFTACT